MGTQVRLDNVRLSFPKLWQPEQFEGTGNPRYGATFLIKPGSDTHKKIQAAIAKEAKEVYKDQAKAVLKALSRNSGKYCYRDGNEPNDSGKVRDEWTDSMVLTANRNATSGAPKVVDRDPKVELDEGAGRPYSGCYVNANVEIWAQKGKYQGIRATLLAVQFYKDGDAFAGAPATADCFEDLSDTGNFEGGEEDDLFGDAEDDNDDDDV